MVVASSEVKTRIMTPQEAVENGALALFGEKYGDEVRVLTMGDGFSVELCGGTHVLCTGDIGVFKIISETGVAAGIRRIEAITGDLALSYFDKLERDLERLSLALKSTPENILEKATILLSESKELEKQNTRLKAKIAGLAGNDLLSTARDIKGVKVLSAIIEGVDPKTLRDTVDKIKNQLGQSVVILAVPNKDKIVLVSGLTQGVPKSVHAGKLMEFVATQLGGKGGGRRDMAQGGGINIDALPEAIKSVFGWIEEKLSD
jgi:alanyl-tRNA synthetase